MEFVAVELCVATLRLALKGSRLPIDRDNFGASEAFFAALILYLEFYHKTKGHGEDDDDDVLYRKNILGVGGKTGCDRKRRPAKARGKIRMQSIS